MGLTYATSNRGACHLRGYTVASEVLGIPIKTDPLVTDGQGRPGQGIPGCHLPCSTRRASASFTSFAWTLADVAPQLAAACSDEFTLDELNKIGERIWNLEREFNLRAGFTAKDDTLPKRLLTEPAKTGPAKGPGQRPCPRCCPSTTRREAGDSDGRPTAQTKGAAGTVAACSTNEARHPGQRAPLA